jgi:hypothetical protein
MDVSSRSLFFKSFHCDFNLCLVLKIIMILEHVNVYSKFKDELDLSLLAGFL